MKSPEPDSTLAPVAEFERRCSLLFARLQSGEPMTVEHLAAQLGLPVEFLKAAMAIYAAERDGDLKVFHCLFANSIN